MGLPLFIAPVEVVAPERAAEKTAAGPRSSIRRQRSARGSSARLYENRRARLMSLGGESQQGGLDDFDFDQAPDYRPERTSDLSPWDSSLQEEVQQRVTERMTERANERMRLRDTLMVERSQNPSGFGRPPPQSADTFEQVERLDRTRRALAIQREHRELRDQHRELRDLQTREEIRRLGRRRPAPTPPAELSRVSRGQGVDSSRSSAINPQSAQDDLERLSGTLASARDARANLSERVQALNRASNHLARARRLTRQARLDGLGDRDRSLSPGSLGDSPAVATSFSAPLSPGMESGAGWDTLLTSITPDPQPPTAGSSFASNSAAAAATSSSSSGPSSASASTSMTSLDQPGDEIHICETSDSGSGTEDEEDEDMYELRQYGRDRGDERFWTSYAEAASRRASRAAIGGRVAGRDNLDGMHDIISGLAQQDHIPDEWWASAGLSRNLRREPAN